jgi:hypothetical protein
MHTQSRIGQDIQDHIVSGEVGFEECKSIAYPVTILYRTTLQGKATTHLSLPCIGITHLFSAPRGRQSPWIVNSRLVGFHKICCYLALILSSNVRQCGCGCTLNMCVRHGVGTCPRDGQHWPMCDALHNAFATPNTAPSIYASRQKTNGLFDDKMGRWGYDPRCVAIFL